MRFPMEYMSLASKHSMTKAGLLAACIGAFCAGTALAEGVVQTPEQAQAQRIEAGKKIYQEANCVGCHKWHGSGGGGYGGAALSLRATALTREQIIEVVRCGRPNTGMPHFDRDAYAGTGCYGATKEELGEAAPMAGPRFLRPREIESVVGYVLSEIKGKGEPDYADCTAFFGSTSRMCQHYRTAGADAAGGPADAAGRPIGR